MTSKLRILLLIGLVAVLVTLIRKIRSRKVELRYTMLCMFLIAALLVMVLVPDLLRTISDFLGIYSPVNMLFFLGFVLSLGVIFSLTSTISKMSEEIKTMAQKIALLDGRVSGNSEQEHRETRDE